MASYISIDILCGSCETKWDDLVERGTESGEFPCPSCGGLGKRTWSLPNVTRASYVDGTKRKGFAEGKEAARLHKELSEKAKTDKDRKEILKEIKKTGTKITKDVT